MMGATFVRRGGGSFAPPVVLSVSRPRSIGNPTCPAPFCKKYCALLGQAVAGNPTQYMMEKLSSIMASTGAI